MSLRVAVDVALRHALMGIRSELEVMCDVLCLGYSTGGVLAS